VYCEPHWHPATAEIGYVVQCHARMTIIPLNGANRLHTYKLKEV